MPNLSWRRKPIDALFEVERGTNCLRAEALYNIEAFDRQFGMGIEWVYGYRMGIKEI